MDSVLIVSAELDAPNQERLNGLRERFFPTERNYLDAHLTLFHAIPINQQKNIERLLDEAREALPMPLQLSRLVKFSRGFAVALGADRLKALHQGWQKELKEALCAQDSKRLWPHITLQNKVSPGQAARDYKTCHTLFSPREAHIVAWRLWVYENGPWSPIRRFGIHAE